MSEPGSAWNECGVARSTHGEWPTRSYTMKTPSPDRTTFAESPTRASSWSVRSSPPADISPASFQPAPARPGPAVRSNSSRLSRGEEKRPAPTHRDSGDSIQPAMRPHPRNKFSKDYQECKKRTLDAEQAEEQHAAMIKTASKLGRKQLKERQANPRVYNGTPLATRNWHEEAAELAEIAADAFHDAVKSHRRMLEHYKNRGDKEKSDWHKSIIEKFGSKENAMNSNYSQHITSHTDPSTIRGYVNARRESVLAADSTSRPTKSVGFDLSEEETLDDDRDYQMRKSTYPLYTHQNWVPPHRRSKYMPHTTMMYTSSGTSLSSGTEDGVESETEESAAASLVSSPTKEEKERSAAISIPKVDRKKLLTIPIPIPIPIRMGSKKQPSPPAIKTTETKQYSPSATKPMEVKQLSPPATKTTKIKQPSTSTTKTKEMKMKALSPRVASGPLPSPYIRSPVIVSSPNRPQSAPPLRVTILPVPIPTKEAGKPGSTRLPPHQSQSPIYLRHPHPLSPTSLSPRTRHPPATRQHTPPQQTKHVIPQRRPRSLTRQGSLKRSVSPKIRKSFYDDWDQMKAQRGVNKIGQTGRGPMGRQTAQAVLPWAMLLFSFVT